jgi:Tol biopolymer transport system component
MRVSVDGKRVLISGAENSIYSQGTDSSLPVLIGKGLGGDFSPDGKWIVAASVDGSSLVLLPTGAGQAREVRIEGYRWLSQNAFLPDGRHVVCAGYQKAQEPLLFLVDLEAKSVRNIAPGRAVGMPHVSPDGRRLAFFTSGAPLLGTMEGGSTVPVPGCEAGDAPVGWAADSRHLYVVRLGRMPSRVDAVDTQTGERKLLRELSVLDPAGAISFGGVRVAPDGRTIVFSEGRRYSTLYLVTGVR